MSMGNHSGVYAIVDMQLGMLYVGSSQHIIIRAEQHFHALEDGTHFNYKLQNAHRAHPDKFALVVLEQTTPEQRKIREQVWINRFAKHHKLFNIRKTVE